MRASPTRARDQAGAEASVDTARSDVAAVVVPEAGREPSQSAG
jgi:hypothetical protein